jgi:flagellar FliJ protein
MSTFKFRLQTVLRLRRAVRDERLAELGRAQRAAEVLREQQERIAVEAQENQNAARDLMAKQSSSGANVDGLLHIHRHALVLKAQAAQLAQQQKQVEAEIARRQQALVEADRDVRVLEKLEEKGQIEHDLQELALEQRELDEIAVIRSFRAREVAT